MLLEFLSKVSTQKWVPRATVRTGRPFIRRWSKGEFYLLSGNLQRPANFVVSTVVVRGKRFFFTGEHQRANYLPNLHATAVSFVIAGPPECASPPTFVGTQNTRRKVKTFLFLVTMLSCKHGPAET